MTAATDRALPGAVRSYLAKFVARRRKLALCRAAGWAVAFAAGWLILDCLADRWLHLGHLPREILLGMLAAGALFFLAAAGRHFLSDIDWIQAAEQIEHRGDIFGQRLETITSQALARPAYRGSPQLLKKIAQSLDGDIARGDLCRIVPKTPVFRSWLAAAAILLTLAGLLGIDWLGMPRLLDRAVRPWADLPPVTTTILTVAPGNAVVAQGRDLSVHVEAHRLGGDLPLVSFSTDGQNWQSQAMTSTTADTFDFDLGAIDRDAQYFVTGGDAVSPTFAIHVLRQPAITEFRIRYVYPGYLHSPYTAQHPLEVCNSDGAVEAPQGSTASIAVVSTEPLASATLKTAEKSIPLSATVEPKVRQCKIAIDKDEKATLDLLSDHGVAGSEALTIHAIADLPPTVKFIAPAQDVSLTPRDTLPIVYLATDDYGVSAVSVQVAVNATAQQEFAAPLAGEARYRQGTFLLDLASLNVKSGDLIRLSLVARDTAGQLSAGDEQRYVLVSPRRVDDATRQRVEDLRQSAALAGALALDTEAAAKTLAAARSKAGGDSHEDQPLAEARQDLAAGSDTAAMLGQTLLGTVVHADSPAMAVALGQWIDDAQRLAGPIARATDLVDSPQQGALPQRLTALAARARQLQRDLTTAAGGELAGTIQAERQDARAAGDSSREQQRLERELRQDAARLGLNPSSGDFPDRLAALSKQAGELMARQTPVDFAAPAANWVQRLKQSPQSQSDLPQRLSMAAEAEALRPDADPVRAQDLSLAGRVAAEIAAGNRQVPRDEFPGALAAMQREDNQPAAGGGGDAQSEKARAEAAAARQKMAQWAGAQPPADPALAAALRANAQLAQQDYAAAATDSQVAKAQQIDQLRVRQERLAAKPDATEPAQEQSLAEEIQQLDSRQENEARQSPLATIRQAMDRLAALGGQLPLVLQATAGRRRAAAAVAATQPDAPLQKELAEATVRQREAARAVRPDEADAISQTLAPFSPQTDMAKATIDGQLTPALRQLGQSVAAADDDGADRAVAAAQAAIHSALEQLAEAQDEFMQQDPEAAAHWFAQAAQGELSSGHSQARAAADQRNAARALGMALGQQVGRAGRARLEQVPSLAPIFNGPYEPFVAPANAPAVLRQWGKLQARPADNLNIAEQETDPAGYEESLKAYFQALNRFGQNGSEK